jgi:branched-chain amino acid aminotransferase
MSACVNVNGRITPAAEAVIPVYDHGFLYGEGVYEVYRTYRGVPFLFDRHLARLRASAARIHLPVPMSDADVLARAEDTCRAAGLLPAGDGVPEAYVRILLTRGIGEITYDPAATPTPSLVIIAKPLPVTPPWWYTAGVKVVFVDPIRNHPNSVNPLIKSNNLMNNALGMQQAIREGAAEGVFRNYRGELAECAQSNLFVVSKGVVRTPPLDAGLLAGITRGFVFEIGDSLGVPVREAVLADQDLLAADEAFFTSSTKEIVPIVRVGDAVIGAGLPGPITMKLLDAFRAKALAHRA